MRLRVILGRLLGLRALVAHRRLDYAACVMTTLRAAAAPTRGAPAARASWWYFRPVYNESIDLPISSRPMVVAPPRSDRSVVRQTISTSLLRRSRCVRSGGASCGSQVGAGAGPEPSRLLGRPASCPGDCPSRRRGRRPGSSGAGAKRGRHPFSDRPHRRRDSRQAQLVDQAYDYAH